MSSIDPSRLLAMRAAILEQNSALQRAAGLTPGGGIDGAAPAGGAKEGGFTDALRSALASVNDLQSEASTATEAYERGESTDIASVMLARQKASIGFEATLQVRNKLLTAYKDIMSMPV
ncbi:MAG: flagellar hook-basal body complex protein FliE [Allosphingosinicella sp.]|uniref:flagellar hook-basal body complex protein FliE n=1 Tax=Allosphingosinicella sp. TaxID=2823234 RepID=UPI0039526508